MTGHDCTECGVSLVACNSHIHEYGEGCCAACLVKDSHGLLERPKAEIDALAERIDTVEVNLLAQMVLLRTDLMDAVKAAGEVVARQQRRIDELTERLAHFDHDQAIVDYGLLDDRVDVLERCIASLEQIFKLRRIE